MQELLKLAGVPSERHPEALFALGRAEEASSGLLRAKLHTRLLMAGKIAKALPWDAERLIDVRPEWSQHDIAPVRNISCNGDNGPWVHTPEGGRPVERYWLNPDPQSEEYRIAVSKCYWCPGHHPRSRQAREAWYRRNGGEYLAWQRGEPVNTHAPLEVFTGQHGSLTITVACSSRAWIVKTRRVLAGPLVLTSRNGFESDNVFCGPGNSQVWFPLPGFALLAPATSGSRLRWKK